MAGGGCRFCFPKGEVVVVIKCVGGLGRGSRLCGVNETKRRRNKADVSAIGEMVERSYDEEKAFHSLFQGLNTSHMANEALNRPYII